MTTRPLLALEHVDTHYGPIPILQDINVDIHQGEIVCLLGGNASGKSTTLKTILGLVQPTRGAVYFCGEQIDGLPTGHIVARGISIVPENRRIFPEMTVLENLEMGAYLRRDRDEIEADKARVLDLFPRIGERLSQLGARLDVGPRPDLGFQLDSRLVRRRRPDNFCKRILTLLLSLLLLLLRLPGAAGTDRQHERHHDQSLQHDDSLNHFL